MSFEEIRENFRPEKIRVLMVAESPPPHKGFFYDPTFETQLLRNTRLAFGVKSKDDGKIFLRSFQKRGFYLKDMFGEKGKTIHRANRDEKTTAVLYLSDFMGATKPEYIVCVLRRIDTYVQVAMEKSGIPADYRCLWFPTRQYAIKYRDGLKQLLSELN